MKTFKFSLVLHTCENNFLFITLDENIYGIHSKKRLSSVNTIFTLNSKYWTPFIIIVCLSLLTMTSLNHMREMLLFVCSKMAD